jgi:hypothetical protein
MRAILIILALVALGAIAWVLTQGGDDAPVATSTGEATEGAADVQTEVEGAADAAAGAVEGAAEAAGEAAGAAADDAQQAVGDAVQGAVEAAQGAADAASGATDAVTGAPSSADASAEGSVSPDAMPLEEALSAQTFDAATVREAIAASGLNDLEKQTAQALVDQAEQNPDQIQSVVDQLRTILGL